MNRKIFLFSVLWIILLATGCEKMSPEYIEVQADALMFEEKFYYQQISEEEQLIYREVYQGVKTHAEFITTHGSDPQCANDMLYLIMYDFPELFWIFKWH